MENTCIHIKCVSLTSCILLKRMIYKPCLWGWSSCAAQWLQTPAEQFPASQYNVVNKYVDWLEWYLVFIMCSPNISRESRFLCRSMITSTVTDKSILSCTTMHFAGLCIIHAIVCDQWCFVKSYLYKIIFCFKKRLQNFNIVLIQTLKKCDLVFNSPLPANWHNALYQSCIYVYVKWNYYQQCYYPNPNPWPILMPEIKVVLLLLYYYIIIITFPQNIVEILQNIDDVICKAFLLCYLPYIWAQRKQYFEFVSTEIKIGQTYQQYKKCTSIASRDTYFFVLKVGHVPVIFYFCLLSLPEFMEERSCKYKCYNQTRTK